MNRYLRELLTHSPQILIAAIITLLFVVSAKVLGSFFEQTVVRIASYALLPLVVLGVALLNKDINGIKSAILIGAIWCVNTLMYIFAPQTIVHTALMDVSSITFLVAWDRRYAAGFSAAMVVVSVTVLVGLNSRPLLDYLFFGQCVLLAMQSAPDHILKDGQVLPLNETTINYKKAG